MSFLWISPFGPVIWLAGGAVILILAGKYMRDRRLGNALPAVVAGLGLLFWLALRLQAEMQPLQWSWRTELGWSALLRIQLDGWAWLAGLVLVLVAFVAVALPGWRWRQGFVDPRLWLLLTATCTLLVVLSGSWMAVLAAWALMLLMAGLGAGSTGSGAALTWSTGLLTMTFLLFVPLVNGSGSLEAPIESLRLNPQAQLLLVLAGVIQLAVYPFHIWVTPQALRSPGRQLGVHLLPGLAAFYLLGRFELPLLASQAWVPFVVVALLGSALVSWAAQDAQQSWAFVLINRATWAVLALGLAQAPAPGGAILPLMTLALGAILWAVAGIAAWHYRWQWPALLAIAVLYGLPLTPGLAPNLLLGGLANTSIGLAVWPLLVLAQILFFAALLLRRYPRPEEPGASSAFTPLTLVLTLALSGGLALWWGFYPAVLARLTGSNVADLGGSLFGLLQGAGTASLLTLVLPIALGVLLAATDERLFGSIRGWQDNVAQVGSLRWLYGGVERVLYWLNTGFGFVADIVDGAGQFGFVLLAVLIAWLLLAA